MDDVEAQIEAWASHAADHVAPVTADEAIAVATAERARPRFGHRALAVAAALVLAAGATSVAVTVGRHPVRESVRSGPGSEHWTTSTLAPFGWTIERPTTWTSQRAESCPSARGVILVSNRSGPLPHRSSVSGGCTSPWPSPDLEDNRLAAVEIVRVSHGMPSSGGMPELADTALPVTYDEMTSDVERAPGHLVDRSIGVRVGGQSFVIETLLGPDASRTDRSAVRRMVASIRWPVGEAAPADPLEAVWPDTPTSRRGPSQSPFEAARDGVIPPLAALPLAERANPTLGLRSSEGDWWLVRAPQALATPDTGSFGDPEGADGIDRIGVAEYGEILLLDKAGGIRRAYPQPNEVPSWIIVTDEAVIAGRVGDGGAPDSTITRIDRTSLDARTIVFPCHCADGGDPFLLPGWIEAPPGEPFSRFFSSSPGSTGTPAASWATVVARLDVPAIEALFARLDH